MAKPRILAFSGSARSESFNQRLVKIAANGAVSSGAEVKVVNLGDFNLPIFNEDLEAEGTPPAAQELKDLFLAHDGLLIASPEYNSSLTSLLKNAIDWVSRPAPNEPQLAAYQGKTAAIMAASPGGLGGLRGLVHLRAILGNLGVLVLPKQIAVSHAGNAFDDTGNLLDAGRQASIEGLGALLAQLTRCLAEPQA